MRNCTTLSLPRRPPWAESSPCLLSPHLRAAHAAQASRFPPSHLCAFSSPPLFPPWRGAPASGFTLHASCLAFSSLSVYTSPTIICSPGFKYHRDAADSQTPVSTSPLNSRNALLNFHLGWLIGISNFICSKPNSSLSHPKAPPFLVFTWSFHLNKRQLYPLAVFYLSWVKD